VAVSIRRVVVVGAGAAGGTLGGLLSLAGHEVVLVARGAHGAALAAHGLQLRTTTGEHVLRLPVASAPGGARFIVPDQAGIAHILAKHTFLRALEVPSGAYPGQTASIASVGSWSFVMARPTLPDDVAYRLARALHQGEAALGRRLAQARETTAANTVSGAPRLDLIHPGVLRYLREAGVIK
jgi:choline dehydrogenase-like flavoprotein